MSEVLTIKCDRCGSRVGKASRTRIRFGAQPFRREPMDACPDCSQLILVALGKAQPEPQPTRVRVRTPSHQPVEVDR